MILKILAFIVLLPIMVILEIISASLKDNKPRKLR